MAIVPLIGASAGLVSALLFGVMATLSPMGMLLSYMAPLPILIAALGWNHRAGLMACVVGAILCSSFLAFSAGVVFSIGVALPAWWLAYLALLGRKDSAGQMEWYPLGRMLAWMVATAALITLIGAISLGPSYEEYNHSLETLIRALANAELLPTFVDDTDVDHFVGVIAATVPAVAAVTFVCMLAVNLWLAAFTVRLSGRLPRPWPSLPDTLMPRMSLLATGAAALGTAFLPGYLGLTATAVLGALVVTLTLQGLATAHAATRGYQARPLLLTLLYVSLLLLSIWLVPVLVSVGAIAIAWKTRQKDNTNLPFPPH